MSEEILSSLQAELSRRNQLVDDRRAALEAAVSERDAFVDQIATTLSLGKRAPAESTRTRQEKVLALHNAGNGQGEIAKILKIKDTTAGYDLRKLRERGEIPPANQNNEDTKKESMVLELYKEGNAISDIAETLTITRNAADATVHRLRAKGLLPPASGAAEASSDQSTVASEQDQESEDDKTDGEEIPEGEEERGATKAELVAEVKRQQGGVTSKGATLKTTTVRRHRHQVKVDRMGDGQTAPDGSGHAHRCFRYVLSSAQGHEHDLVV